MDHGAEFCLLYDDDGYSTDKWENGQTYKLRVKGTTSVDIDLPFSEKNREKMSVFSVRNDFGIQIDRSPWQFSDDDTLCSFSSELITVPPALIETLALYAEFNTQKSRRSIVSLFLHCAISTVLEGKKKLCIDEETPLSIIRSVERYGERKNVRYSGPVDFVIGHSKTDRNMPEDSAVMVIEVKKNDTFDDCLPQAMAQAASLLYFRRGMTPPRGLNGSGGPIVFIRTDGERWIFSKMTCKDGVPTVQHSEEFKINISQTKIENDTVQCIFNWIRYAITIGRESSPT